MAALKREGRRLLLTPHVLYEAYCGVWRNPSEERRIERIRGRLATLPFEHHAAREAARMSAVLLREGAQIPIGDLLIAASTIVWGDCEIITGDAQHFRRLGGFGLIVNDSR